mgnify:CR=1 FL=1|tara:strand:- start:1401 stop:1610 length:210 start_codon:yes stop_codon:yes gene_type:complete
MVKVGDLVNFHTEAWIFSHANKRYANPGIVINLLGAADHGRSEVFWSDGKITIEHDSFLQSIEETHESW